MLQTGTNRAEDEELRSRARIRNRRHAITEREEHASVYEMAPLVAERRHANPQVVGQDTGEVGDFIERTADRRAVSAHPELVVAANRPRPRLLIKQEDVPPADDDTIDLEGAPVGSRQHLIANHNPLGGEVGKLACGAALTLSCKRSGCDDLRHWVLLRNYE